MNIRGSVLLAVLAVVGQVHAEDILIFSNAGGGITAITDQPCERGGTITKQTNSGGVVELWGCAIHVTADLAKIRWSHGQETYFNLNWGTPTEALRRRIEKATAKAPIRRAGKSKTYSSPYYDND
jgi:hypothetical protein